MSRILVYRLGSLGDTCVALPALKLVRRYWPAAKITLLTNLPVSTKAAPAPALLDGMGLVEDCLAYPVGTRNPVTLTRLAWTLRRRRFEAVVNLAAWRGASSLRRDARFFQVCGIKRMVGFQLAETGDLRVDATGQTEPEAERLLRRVSQLGQANLRERRWYDLELKPGEQERADALLREVGVAGEFLAFGLGTKVAAKDWEAERWTQLVAGLASRFPRLGAVAVGAQDERQRADECFGRWTGPRANFCGALAPRASAAVLARAELLVGHDSGPMHLAAAVGTPCVAIFSARNLPRQWFPLGEGHEVFYRRVACVGCGLDECVVEKKRCIRSITVDEVLAAVAGKLGTARKSLAFP